MGKCTSLFGHKFEARYDIGPINPEIRFKGHVGDTVEFINSLRPKTYVQDVCVRCGQIVERKR